MPTAVISLRGMPSTHSPFLGSFAPHLDAMGIVHQPIEDAFNFFASCFFGVAGCAFRDDCRPSFRRVFLRGYRHSRKNNRATNALKMPSVAPENNADADVKRTSRKLDRGGPVRQDSFR
jgi:hypothetical protein